MKILLYIIAALLVIIWIIQFRPSEIVHVWLVLAACILIITIVFSKQLSRK